MILAANHASHLDTGLLLSSLPARLRHRTMVAAAADYFFDRRWKAAFWSFGLGGDPDGALEGQPPFRRSRRLARQGGLEPDHLPRRRAHRRRLGPGVQGRRRLPRQALRGPGRPGSLRGTRAVLAKSSSRLRPGATEIRLGDALSPAEGEDARKFAARIEQAVGDARRRGRVGLVVRPAASRGGHDASVSGSGRLPVASGMVAARFGAQGPARASASAGGANPGAGMTDRDGAPDCAVARAWPATVRSALCGLAAFGARRRAVGLRSERRARQRRAGPALGAARHRRRPGDEPADGRAGRDRGERHLRDQRRRKQRRRARGDRAADLGERGQRRPSATGVSVYTAFNPVDRHCLGTFVLAPGSATTVLGESTAGHLRLLVRPDDLDRVHGQHRFATEATVPTGWAKGDPSSTGWPLP